MAELDFYGLRTSVEAATTLPEFADIQRRARRLRLRSRLATTAVVLSTLAVMVPSGVLAARARNAQHPTVLGVGPVTGPTTADSPSPTRPTVPARVLIMAAAGSNLAHVWVAVDVCVASRCNLQLSAIRDGRDTDGPARVGQLRRQPTDRVSNVTLTARGNDTIQLGGDVAGAGRQYYRMDAAGSGPDGPAKGPRVRAAVPGDLVVQDREHGTVSVVDPATGVSDRLPTQPDLQQPDVVPGIDPGHGIWITGRSGGDAALAVSHDGGRTWRVHTVDAPAGSAPVVLTTADGGTAYLYVSTPSGLRQWRSSDGGLGWTAVPVRMPWPPASSGTFGAVVRPDGSLLAWQDGTPAPVFLESTDRGASFHAASGPCGPVVMVPDGYVAIGQCASLSRDARNWAAVAVPYLVVDG